MALPPHLPRHPLPCFAVTRATMELIHHVCYQSPCSRAGLSDFLPAASPEGRTCLVWSRGSAGPGWGQESLPGRLSGAVATASLTVLLDRILGSTFEGLPLRLCSSPSLSVLTFSRGTRVYGPELTRQAESCVILTSALSGSQSTTRRSECPQRPADPGGRHLGRAWPGEAGLTSSHPQL